MPWLFEKQNIDNTAMPRNRLYGLDSSRTPVLASGFITPVCWRIQESNLQRAKGLGVFYSFSGNEDIYVETNEDITGNSDTLTIVTADVDGRIKPSDDDTGIGVVKGTYNRGEVVKVVYLNTARGSGGGGSGDGDITGVIAGTGLSGGGASGNVTLNIENPFTSADETKLDGIESGAEVNVQSNWSETNTNSDAYIRNKPTLAVDTTLWRGNWQTRTAYKVGDIVVYNSELYLYTTAVDSTNTTTPNNDSNAEHLTLDTDPNTFTNASIAGDVITFSQADGSNISVTIPSRRGAGDGLDLNSNDLEVNIDGDTLSVSASGVKLADGVARDRGDWRANASYVVGDIVEHSNIIYRCKTSNSDATFTASKWDDLSTDTQPSAPTKAEVYAQSKVIFKAGSNITISENDTNSELTIESTGGGGGTNPRGAGDGLVLDGSNLDVNVGDGLEIASDKVKVKADGDSLTVGSDGVSVTKPLPVTELVASIFDGGQSEAMTGGGDIPNANRDFRLEADMGNNGTHSIQVFFSVQTDLDLFKMMVQENYLLVVKGNNQFVGRIVARDTQVLNSAFKIYMVNVPALTTTTTGYTGSCIVKSERHGLSETDYVSLQNVQSDFNQTSNTNDAYIKNKPADNRYVPTGGSVGNLVRRKTGGGIEYFADDKLTAKDLDRTVYGYSIINGNAANVALNSGVANWRLLDSSRVSIINNTQTLNSSIFASGKSASDIAFLELTTKQIRDGSFFSDPEVWSDLNDVVSGNTIKIREYNYTNHSVSTRQLVLTVTGAPTDVTNGKRIPVTATGTMQFNEQSFYRIALEDIADVTVSPSTLVAGKMGAAFPEDIEPFKGYGEDASGKSGRYSIHQLQGPQLSYSVGTNITNPGDMLFSTDNTGGNAGPNGEEDFLGIYPRPGEKYILEQIEVGQEMLAVTPTQKLGIIVTSIDLAPDTTIRRFWFTETVVRDNVGTYDQFNTGTATLYTSIFPYVHSDGTHAGHFATETSYSDIDLAIVKDGDLKKLDPLVLAQDPNFVAEIQSFNEPQDFTGNYTRKATPATAGQWGLNAVPADLGTQVNGNPTVAQLTFIPKSGDTAYFSSHWIVGAQIQFGSGNSEYVVQIINGVSASGGQWVAGVQRVTGTIIAEDASTTVELRGFDPHRTEFVLPVWKDSSINIAGAGGTQDQVWTRGSNGTNANWADIVETQSDWNVTDSTSAAFIKNKPTLAVDTTLWKGTYADSTAYAVGDLVVYSGHIYIVVTAVANTNTTNPDVNSSFDLLTLDTDPNTFTDASIAGDVITFTQADTSTVTVTVPSRRGAGDGLVLDTNDLDINVGDGVEISSDKVRVKLDGSSLTRSSNGLKVTNEFTSTLKTKLDGIAAGAEVNVQSDWDATSGDALILNKPTIPTVDDDSILDAVKATRVVGDRGKLLGISKTNQNELALLSQQSTQQIPNGPKYLESVDDIPDYGTGSYREFKQVCANDEIYMVSFWENTGDKRTQEYIFRFQDLGTSFNNARWLVFEGGGQRVVPWRSGNKIRVARGGAVQADNHCILWRMDEPIAESFGEGFLDSIQASRGSADRGKAVAISSTDEDTLVLTDFPTINDDAILDLVKETRVTGDRGKALGVSTTNQNELAFLDVPTVDDDAILDLAKATRVTGDRGKALTVSSTDEDALALTDITSFDPSNDGTTAQVLTKTSSGYNWADASGGSDISSDFKDILFKNGVITTQFAYLVSSAPNFNGALRFATDSGGGSTYDHTIECYFTSQATLDLFNSLTKYNDYIRVVATATGGTGDNVFKVTQATVSGSRGLSALFKVGIKKITELSSGGLPSHFAQGSFYGQGNFVTDRNILDIIQVSRANSDRGKVLTVSSTNQNQLALSPFYEYKKIFENTAFTYGRSGGSFTQGGTNTTGEGFSVSTFDGFYGFLYCRIAPETLYGKNYMVVGTRITIGTSVYYYMGVTAGNAQAIYYNDGTGNNRKSWYIVPFTINSANNLLSTSWAQIQFGGAFANGVTGDGNSTTAQNVKVELITVPKPT